MSFNDDFYHDKQFLKIRFRKKFWNICAEFMGNRDSPSIKISKRKKREKKKAIFQVEHFNKIVFFLKNTTRRVEIFEKNP